MKSITLILIITVITSCIQPKPVESDYCAVFAEEFAPFVTYFYRKHFYLIQTRYSECGEWGGHTERIWIDRDTLDNLVGEYLIYPVNCDPDSLYYYNEIDVDSLKPVFWTQFAIDINGQKELKKYSLDLLNQIYNQYSTGNAADVFTVQIWGETSIRCASDPGKYTPRYEKLLQGLDLLKYHDQFNWADE